MKILFVGSEAPQSSAAHRAGALRRLGHEVTTLDPAALLRTDLNGRIRSALHYRTGYRWLQNKLAAALDRDPKTMESWPVVWVDSGELIGPRPAEALRRRAGRLVLYNLDDPTGTRDGNRWASLRRALPVYDLCVTVRRETEAEMSALGARKVLRVWRSYDEVVHHPLRPAAEIPAAFQSEVGFVGTWMPGRGALMKRLLDRDVPLSIWGYRWERAPEWNDIRRAWRGGDLKGRDYVMALEGAKISLGLLSKGNRDLHTQRSFEIPFVGSVFCAERTPEHLELYRENEEAVYWDDADECAESCLSLLADDGRRERVRVAGMRRVRELGVGNEDVCRKILAALPA